MRIIKSTLVLQPNLWLVILTKYISNNLSLFIGAIFRHNLFALAMVILSLPVLATSSKKSIPDFKFLQGDWTYSVSWLSEAYGDNKKGIADVSLIKNYQLKAEVDCKAVTINIDEEELLTGVISCSNSKYFLCSGHIEGCRLPVRFGDSEFNNETELNKNTLIVHPEYKEIRYVLEFLGEKIIFRYQRKNCFISYPHGCLIDAFSWRDIGSYKIEKANGINNKELN